MSVRQTHGEKRLGRMQGCRKDVRLQRQRAEILKHGGRLSFVARMKGGDMRLLDMIEVRGQVEMKREEI